MQKGSRWLDGRCFDLYCSQDWMPEYPEHEEALAREVSSVRAKIARGEYQYMRVIRDKRRYRAFVYVL